MKLKKFITVGLLAGLCITAGHSATAKASVIEDMDVDNTVISNQVTDENDTSNGTVDFANLSEGEEILADVVPSEEEESVQNVQDTTEVVVSDINEDVAASKTEDVVTNGAVQVVTEEAVTTVTEPAVANAAPLTTTKEVTKTETVTKNETVDKKTSTTTTTTKVVEEKKTTQTTTSKKKYTNAELRLMSCIIYAEANGEPYAGKLAVGIVVMNRKSSKSFPNTVKGVIYQKYQFGPVRNGSLNRAMKAYDAGKFTSPAAKACVKAAKAALNGTKKVTYGSKTYNMKGYYFFSTYVRGKRLTIKNHQFK